MTVEADLIGIEMLNPANFKTEALLVSDLTKKDVPIDSEVFIETDK